jgi:hypothetical protein
MKYHPTAGSGEASPGADEGEANADHAALAKDSHKGSSSARDMNSHQALEGSLYGSAFLMGK